MLIIGLTLNFEIKARAEFTEFMVIDVFMNIMHKADKLLVCQHLLFYEEPVNRPEPVFIIPVEVTEISLLLESSIRAEERERAYLQHSLLSQVCFS